MSAKADMALPRHPAGQEGPQVGRVSNAPEGLRKQARHRRKSAHPPLRPPASTLGARISSCLQGGAAPVDPQENRRAAYGARHCQMVGARHARPKRAARGSAPAAQGRGAFDSSCAPWRSEIVGTKGVPPINSTPRLRRGSNKGHGFS